MNTGKSACVCEGVSAHHLALHLLLCPGHGGWFRDTVRRAQQTCRPLPLGKAPACPGLHTAPGPGSGAGFRQHI